MGDQQARLIEDRIFKLGINAVLGDGHLWKHPTCTNYKVIYTSTTPELLEVKQSIEPSIFTSGVSLINTDAAKGRFANAKPLYRLASIVHPIFTYLKSKDKEELFSNMDLEVLGLWYLDDGCYIKRSDGNSYRYFMCIGDCCNSASREAAFRAQLEKLFGPKYGSIRLNNSKATENNKNWVMPKEIAIQVLKEALKYNVLQYKIPPFLL